MGSFGPVLALASLSNNLNQTLAGGELENLCCRCWRKNQWSWKIHGIKAADAILGCEKRKSGSIR